MAVGSVFVAAGIVVGSDWLAASTSARTDSNTLTFALTLPRAPGSDGQLDVGPAVSARQVSLPVTPLETDVSSLSAPFDPDGTALEPPETGDAGPSSTNDVPFELQWTTVTVRPGDSLFTIFRRNEIPVRLLNTLVNSGEAGKSLATLQPGQDLMIGRRPDGRFAALDAEHDGEWTRFVRAGDDFTASLRPQPKVGTESPAPRISAETADQSLDVMASATVTEVTVASGDSFYVLFKRLGFSESEFAALLEDKSLKSELTRINPGQRFVFHAGNDGVLQRLVYDIDVERSLRVDRVGDSFHGSYVQTELESRLSTASGVIESSLFLSGQAAGLTDRLTMKMAEVFGWDIDFAMDIRSGDRFTVLYEELYKDGEMVKQGDVLAAEFVNKGRVIRAVRFQAEDGPVGYFTPEGLSMRTAFLRSPMKVSRITSSFNLNRLHPVLHTIRAHRGVDYAGPRGTPVMATGDGKVAFAGRKGGYGKTVVLRHGGSYTTLYAHLNGFARGIREGAVVKQGQVIGFVGSTGLATGPHLHYEFRVNGAHKNPVTVALPKALPIEPAQKEAFRSQTHALLAQLELLSKTQVAIRSD